MRYMTLRRAVIFAISIIITAAGARIGNSQYPPETPPVVSPEGWTIFEENYLTHFQDEPEIYFHKAQKNFLKKEMKSAAADIRKAAVFLALQSTRSTHEGEKLLMMSVDELGKLSSKVKKETVTSVKELDYAFARAHFALAKHHYLKAKELWAKKDAKKASHDLLAAALNLENALIWSGRELEASIVAAIKEVCFVTGKKIEETGWLLEEKGKTIEYKETGEVSKDFAKAIERIGEEIVKLGRVIEPKIKYIPDYEKE